MSGTVGLRKAYTAPNTSNKYLLIELEIVFKISFMIYINRKHLPTPTVVVSMGYKPRNDNPLDSRSLLMIGVRCSAPCTAPIRASDFVKRNRLCSFGFPSSPFSQDLSGSQVGKHTYIYIRRPPESFPGRFVGLIIVSSIKMCCPRSSSIPVPSSITTSAVAPRSLNFIVESIKNY